MMDEEAHAAERPLVNRIVDGAAVIGLNLQDPLDPVWFGVGVYMRIAQVTSWVECRCP